jgi:hypothetical protein
MDLAFADYVADDVAIFNNDPIGKLFDMEECFRRQFGLIYIDGGALISGFNPWKKMIDMEYP